MSMQPRFGLNHMVCPSFTVSEFLDLSGKLKAQTVEFRNDVGDNSLTDLDTALKAGQQAKELGIRVLSINALYPFNVWNEEREAQTRELLSLLKPLTQKAWSAAHSTTAQPSVTKISNTLLLSLPKY